MPLKSILLENFMSHRHSEIEFDPVITSLCGDSEHGKTNVWRAARLLFMNGDWPEDLIRDGQPSGRILGKLTDGRMVERQRNATGSKLKLYDASGKSEIFVGKKNTGEYLADFCGFRRVQMGENSGEEDLNFVKVGADSLLFVGNYSSIQRRVSAIVGGSRLEDAKNRLLKAVRKTRTRLDSVLDSETRAAAVADELELFLKDSKHTAQKLTELHTQWQQVGNNINELQEVHDDLIKSEQVKHHMSIYDAPDWEKLQKDLKRIEDLVAWLEKFESAIKEVGLAKAKATLLALSTAQLAEHQVELQSMEPEASVCEACGRPL